MLNKFNLSPKDIGRKKTRHACNFLHDISPIHKYNQLITVFFMLPPASSIKMKNIAKELPIIPDTVTCMANGSLRILFWAK